MYRYIVIDISQFLPCLLPLRTYLGLLVYGLSPLLQAGHKVDEAAAERGVSVLTPKPREATIALRTLYMIHFHTFNSASFCYLTGKVDRRDLEGSRNRKRDGLLILGALTE